MTGIVTFGAEASLSAAAANTSFQRDLIESFCTEIAAGRETTTLQLWKELKSKMQASPGSNWLKVFDAVDARMLSSPSN